MIALGFASLRLGLGGVGGTFVLGLLVLAAFWVARRAYTDTEPALSGGRRRVLTLLRGLVLLLLVAMIAEPVLHRQREIRVDPGVLLLVDDSASMGIRGAAGTSRLDEALALRETVARRLDRRDVPKTLWAGEGARRLVRSRTLPEAGSAQPPARGEGTDLPALLLSSAQRHLEDNLSAIVLFSDGRSTTERSPSIEGLGLPVFTVAVGDTLGPPDLRLDRVRHPTFVHRGERLQLDAELVVDTESAGSSTVLLERNGVAIDSLEVSWPRDGGRSPLQFVVTADSLGPQRLELRVRELEAEPLAENNRVQVGYEVRKDRLRVFYLEERPSWNFHFLSRLAAKDRRFEFVGVYRAADGLRLAGTDSTVSWPLDDEARSEIDLWIAGSLADVPTLLDPQAGVAESVRAGAGFWALAGDALGRGGPARIDESLSSWLPVALPARPRWLNAELRASVAAEGRSHAVLALPSGFEDVEARLQALPPLRSLIAPAEPREDARVLMLARNDRFRHPLLVVREEGAGRVGAWLGSPLWSWSFWRLGAGENEGLFDALFGNLLSYLAEGGARERLRLFLPAPVLAQGQDAVARAMALDRRLRPDASSDVWLEWTRVDDSAAESSPSGRARMELDARSSGGRQLAMPALPPGDYRFRVALEEGEERFESEWVDLSVDPYSVEFRDPGVDRVALRDVARRTGGAELRPDELEPWADGWKLEPRQATLTGRLDLWASLWLFLPLIVALGLEWALRKRWGLI